MEGPLRIMRLLLLVFLLADTFAFAVTATPVRETDAVCANCHRDIFNRYVKTPMANASGLATDHFIPGTLENPASGLTYRVFEEDGTAWLSYHDPQAPLSDGRRKLDYFLGSGHLGVTYLYTVNQYLLESPVAYYSTTGRYDMKPGLTALRDIPPALPMEPGCLRCHMSGVQHSEPGTVNHYAQEPFLSGGITCESCHGDTRAHVMSGGKTPAINPATLDTARRDSLCISCHLEGDVSVEHEGRSAVDFKPGDSIADYLSYFVYASNDPTARGVSEVEQLSASTCKRASGSRMSCTTCHDPHYSPPAAERVSFYRGKCLTCHSDPAFVKAHHPENPDCTSCHMPRSTAQNIPHVAWTDHRILRQPAMKVAMNDATQSNVLTPVFSPSASPRDLALAYYESAMKGRSAVRDKAYELLSQARQAQPNDVAVLASLGILTETRGDYQQAASIFRKVLSLDSDNLTAATNLGVLLAKSGDLPGALKLLQPAFQRNEDMLGLAKNLAAVQCMMGDGAAAKATLAKTLVYSPDARDVLDRLKQTSSCTGSQH